MSARDELIQRLANDDYSHDTFAESERAAAEAVDAYAHELAEEIRHVDPALMVGRRDAAVLADLIDPEVSDG